MTLPLRVVAPGKLVLLGEYAVVDGAPALVLAVDRGVACDVAPAPVREASAPGGDTRFVDAALEAVGAPPARYTFSDVRPLVLPGGAKPGLGGSAAATVAAVLAGHAAAGRVPSLSERLDQAVAVHRAVQGSGSGVDVAASTVGGVVRWQGGRAEAVAAATPPLVVVYSGSPAATGPRVRQYQAWAGRAGFVAAMGDAVARWGDDPVGAVRDAGAALRRMAEAAGIAYWTPGIDQAVALAAACGGAGKPSGAGGGDVVVAVFPDGEAAARYAGRVAAAGLVVVPVAVAPGAALWPGW